MNKSSKILQGLQLQHKVHHVLVNCCEVIGANLVELNCLNCQAIGNSMDCEKSFFQGKAKIDFGL